MSLLSYTRLLQLIDSGVIQNSNPDLVNSASIDIRLGRYIFVEDIDHIGEPLTLRDRTPLKGRRVDLQDHPNGYVLFPDQFILAQSVETFNLPPHISAEYKLKSSMARIGLEHMNAGWCDAGWHGSVLTLELKNMTQNHAIKLFEGDKIGQVVFFEHEAVPTEASYATKGNYNNDKTVTGAKKSGDRDACTDSK